MIGSPDSDPEYIKLVSMLATVTYHHLRSANRPLVSERRTEKCIGGKHTMGHKYLERAIECVAREQHWTNEELQAFDEFERHIRNTDVQDAPEKAPQTPGAPSQSGLLTAVQPSPETQRARIRETYAETVLETSVHNALSS